MKSLFLVVVIAIYTLVNNAAGLQEISRDLSGTCGNNLTWTLSHAILTINGTGDMYDYHTSSPPWNDEITSIKAIIIEEGATSLGKSAFRGCVNLTQVSIPNTVTLIDDSCFERCTSLTSVYIPASVKYLATGVVCAFDGCTSLVSIDVDESNQGYQSIDGVLFSRKGKSLYFYPLGITNGTYRVPDGIEEISRYSLMNSKINTLIFPASIKKVRTESFYYCTSLASIEVDENNEEYASLDGVLFGRKDHSLIKYPENKTDDDYAVPDGVNVIYSDAFWRNKHLKSVFVPESVNFMGSECFFDCGNLTNATIMGRISVLPYRCFSICPNLKSVTLPDSIFSIDSDAFYYCTNLESINIPESVIDISQSAFVSCVSLTNLIIPSGVKSIGNLAFIGCSSLKTVTIPSGVTTIGSNAFAQCTQLHSVFYQGSNNLGVDFFYGDKALDTVCVSSQYPGSSFGGKNVTSDKEVCKTFQSLINSCYAPYYVEEDDEFVERMLWNASTWVNQPEQCGVYECDNNSGRVGWSLCNDSNTKSQMCMDDMCLDDWEGKLKGWSVILEYENGISFDEMTISELMYEIQSSVYDLYLNNNCTRNISIGVETNDEGFVTKNMIKVVDRGSAFAIDQVVTRIYRGQNCKYPLLCNVTNVTIEGGNHPTSSSSTATTVHTTTLMNMVLLLLVWGVMIITMF